MRDALRASAAGLRAQADALDALADCYDVATESPATTAGKPAPAGKPATTAAAVPTATLDEVKDLLARVVKNDAGNRQARVDPLLVKICGSVMKIAEVSPEHYPALKAAAQEMLQATPPPPPVTTGDDL